MKRLVLGLVLLTAIAINLTGAALAQAGPEFRASFKALADQIPNVAGQPVGDEHWDASGNLVQQTSTGLMVWRVSDRWTLFTNGFMTWILGPYGLQSRLNTDLYPWEIVLPGPSPVSASPAPPTEPAAPSQPAPPVPTPLSSVPTAVPLPPPPPTAVTAFAPSYVPDIRAMDDEAGGPGVMVKSFVEATAEEWARVWGWRPHRPATFYLYRNGANFAADYARITGVTLGHGAAESLATTGAVVRGADLLTGGYAALFNLNYRTGTDDWEDTTKALALHEYAYMMQTDLAGNAGPTWFREGLAQWCAYSRVWETPAERSVEGYAILFKNRGTLPTLGTLTTSWDSFVAPGGENVEAAFGASYLAVKYLASRVGGMPLLQTLQRNAAGQDFDSALEATTGYSISRLESEYRSAVYP